MNKLAESFGSMVFGDEVMKARLPESIYQSLQSARRVGHRLTPEEADVVAEAMKDWALEKGATQIGRAHV